MPRRHRLADITITAARPKAISGTFVVIDRAPTPVELAMRTDPCLLGQHRAAWLVSGGVACGRCGVPL